MLSQATDAAMGQGRDFALAACRLALRLGGELGLGEEDLRQAYYQAHLRFIGCNAETSLLASVAGDEILLRRDFARADTANPSEVALILVRTLRKARPDSGPWQLARMAARGLLALPRVKAGFGAHCEVAQRLAGRLGLGGTLVEALGQLYERWDGKGAPLGLRGEAIAMSTRLVTLAQDAVVFHRLGGAEAARAMVRKRKGSTYDPRLAEAFDSRAASLLPGLEGEQDWDGALAEEPGRPRTLSATGFEEALGVLADFADMKSPFTMGHSPAVAALVTSAAEKAGFGSEETDMLRHAALIHNLGRSAVTTSIWDKPGALSGREWDQVRLHPYHGERLLSRSAALAPPGHLASRHQERLDASGYHRALPGALLTPSMRLLAAAVAYRSMTEPRPHREALQPEEAAATLQGESRAGRLDPESVRAVLAAAGQAGPVHRTGGVAGLSPRETEVLRLLARGATLKQIAASLSISAKTADRHTQNIYGKIGVSTRAAAALFAAEHHLLA